MSNNVTGNVRDYDYGYPTVGFLANRVSTKQVRLCSGLTWFSVFSRPTKAVITNASETAFTLQTKIYYTNMIAQCVWNMSNDYLIDRHVAYRRDKIYSLVGSTLSFDMSQNGAYTPFDEINGIVLTVHYTDGTPDQYVRLFRYATGTGQTMSVSIDFDTAMTGWSDEDPLSAPLKLDDIKQLSLAVAPAGYSTASNPITNPLHGYLYVSNISSNLFIDEGTINHPVRDMGICTGFDNVINVPPRLLLEDLYNLGYRGSVNHYIGISNYNGLIYDAGSGEFQLDVNNPVDSVILNWHSDFLSNAASLGFEPIIGISFELFYPFIRHKYPEWLQVSEEFVVTYASGNVIRIDGYYPYETVFNEYLGGYQYNGLFNPDSEYARRITVQGYPYDVLGVVAVGDYDESNSYTELTLSTNYYHSIGNTIDKKPSLTGYIPPSSFVSPCNVGGLDFLVNAFKEICTVWNVGTRRFQVGEPWWWDGPFQNRTFFGYDDTAKAQFLAETGQNLPYWRTVTEYSASDETPTETQAIEFYTRKLGEACAYIKDQTKASYTSEFGCLVFIPQIFSTFSELTPQINFPRQYWEYPNYDFFQFECYDSLINRDYEYTFQKCDLAYEMMGYPPEDCNYLAGFVPTADQATTIWPFVVGSTVWSSGLGMESLLWSSTQVNRDNLLLD